MGEQRACVSRRKKILLIELRACSTRLSITILRGVLRNLFYEIAMTIAMRHLTLAERPCDFVLIEMKQKIGERHGVELQHDGRNADGC